MIESFLCVTCALLGLACKQHVCMQSRVGWLASSTCACRLDKPKNAPTVPFDPLDPKVRCHVGRRRRWWRWWRGCHPPTQLGDVGARVCSTPPRGAVPADGLSTARTRVRGHHAVICVVGELERNSPSRVNSAAEIVPWFGPARTVLPRAAGNKSR
jgi:hypothetical protein